MARTESNRFLEDPATPGVESRIREAIDGYPAALVPLIGEAYGPDSVQHAWREFTSGTRTPFNGDDVHGELFFSWLFHSWSPAAGKGDEPADPSLYGIPPTRAYLTRHSRNLDPLLRRYLEACLETPFGFYQITECRPGLGFRVRQLLVGAETDVVDRLASTSLRKGDITFARLPSLERICLPDAISPVSFPASFRKQFIGSEVSSSHTQSDRALRKSYFSLLETYLRTRLPKIRTSAGEVVDGAAAYLGVGASAHATEVLCGPGPKRARRRAANLVPRKRLLRLESGDQVR